MTSAVNTTAAATHQLMRAHTNWRAVAHTNFSTMDESQLTQLPSGELLLMMRHKAEPWKGKGIARSRDGGDTWSGVSFELGLPGPVCQASIATISGSTFFSGPKCARAFER